jgi:predicted kinase
MPKCYQLIGVPGAGKSTWYSEQKWANDCVYISTDIHVENIARSEGKTYTEVFKDAMPYALEQMLEEVRLAHKYNSDIIWDQTSTTIASRRRKFNMLPNYEHIAVVFRTPEKDELDRRLKSRYDYGKIIPEEVVQSMINNWEEPTEAEGFKEIWYT